MANKKRSGKSGSVKKSFLVRKLALFVLITILLGVSLLWQNQINTALRLTSVTDGAYNGTQASTIRGTGGDLVVHFVDVGQGDAAILELPDDRIVLIDAGPKKNQEQLLTYFSANFPALTTIDIAIMTHSDEDHCGGFPAVLDKYPVKDFYRPNELASRAQFVDPDANKIVGTGKKDTAIYRDTIQKAHEKSNEVIVLNAQSLDDAGRDIIKPDGKAAGDPGYYELVFFGPYGHSFSDHNNYSPVMIVEYEGKRIALSGDAEKLAEAEFVTNATEKRIPKFSRFTESYSVDVIKLGHHGSRTSSSEDFLNVLTAPAAVSSVLAVISVGYGNSYGHPHPQIIERLKKLNFAEENTLRTDLHGDIVLAVRYDDAAGKFLLFHGATAQNQVETAPVTWLTIAIGLWLILAIILFLPYLSYKNSTPAKKGTSGKNGGNKSPGKTSTKYKRY